VREQPRRRETRCIREASFNHFVRGKEPDHRHRRLLRARRERPRDRRAADKRDELAALHVWMAPAWQEKMQRAAQKSLAVMCPASHDGLSVKG
jgi:hypothetical protein